MSSTKPFFLVMFLMVSALSFSQSNWTLIYENDAEGNAVQGKLSELITAIRDGQNVRIYFKMGRRGQPETYVEHTALVKFTTILNSSQGQLVTAQIDPIIGQTPSYEKEQVLLKENLEWALIASTTGENDTMTRNTITGEIVSHGLVRWGTKWFVEKE